MISLSAPRRRSAALILALALGASACGSGEDTTLPTLATAPPEDSGSASAGPSPVGGADQTEAAEVEGPVPEDDDPSAEQASENLFPDIDVVNIADGATVNLAAELGGGDRPTLLWFWAPH